MKRPPPEASPNGVHDAGHPSTISRAPFSPELRLLEALLAEPAPTKPAVVRWMQGHLSKQGVLLADPWRTPEAAALLGAFPGGWNDLADSNARRRVQGLVLSAAKQAVGDGFLLADALFPHEARSRLLAAFEAPAFAEGRPFGRRLLGAPSVKLLPKGKTPGFVDEDARGAVLRRDWTPNSAALAVDYRQFDCRLALHLAGERVAAGAFVTTVTRNGATLEPTEPWETVCQSADSDGEYLELSVPLTEGAFLDRHLYVARLAPIVWMVDVVRGSDPADWRWQARWDGAAVTGLRGEAAHRGQRLLGLRTQAALLPVSAPTDPFAAGGVRVGLREGAFEFAQEEHARRTVAALAWVWSDEGTLVPAPWRRLTITQDRRPAPTEEAFAFRVASGGRQCVFFRSLEHPRRHAFLGCQTFDETIIGELDKKGDVVPWMRIE